MNSLKQPVGTTDSLDDIAEAIESHLQQCVPNESDLSQELVDGMRYATLGRGKRVRGTLVCATAMFLDAPLGRALVPAAAIECMHAYSLVHDDLPAMDDASLRRGKPSCHKVYGEAIAILVGDALQMTAMEFIANAPQLDANQKLGMVQTLSHAAGACGMVGGQAWDLNTESAAPLTLADLSRLQQAKTMMLISAAVKLGCLAAGTSVFDSSMDSLWRFGDSLGRAFQIADDLLDFEPSTVTGKPSQLDAAHGKQTFVSVLGRDAARHEADRLLGEAKAALDECSRNAALLKELADRCVNRRN